MEARLRLEGDPLLFDEECVPVEKPSTMTTTSPEHCRCRFPMRKFTLDPDDAEADSC
jgi:hypothetical protein